MTDYQYWLSERDRHGELYRGALERIRRNPQGVIDAENFLLERIGSITDPDLKEGAEAFFAVAHEALMLFVSETEMSLAQSGRN